MADELLFMAGVSVNLTFSPMYMDAFPTLDRLF